MTQARVTQAGVEVLLENTPAVRVTQVGLEVLLANTPDARVTQAGLEVLRSTAVAFEGQTLQVIAVIGGPRKVSA